MQWTFDFLVQLCNKSHKKLIVTKTDEATVFWKERQRLFFVSFLCLDMPKRIKWLFADIDELVDKISFNILIWCQLFCQEIIKYKK